MPTIAAAPPTCRRSWCRCCRPRTGGFGLHPRGNFEGFTESASTQKWLEAHPGRHEEYFYLPYGLDCPERFLDHFLKGEENGWEREPRVWLTLRHVDGFTPRKEHEWPLARTHWTRLYLNADGVRLAWQVPWECVTNRVHGAEG